MKFQRTKLRTAVVAAMNQEKADHDRNVKKYEDAVAEASDKWLCDYEDDWREALVGIHTKLDRGEPILRTDIPRYAKGAYRDNLLVYGGPINDRGYRIDGPREFQESSDLRALLTVLDLISDDEITTHALKELGLGQGVMGRVVRQLKTDS